MWPSLWGYLGLTPCGGVKDLNHSEHRCNLTLLTTSPCPQLSSPFGPADKTLPAIRSIDYSEELGKILVGTNNCDVIELTDTTNVSSRRGKAEGRGKGGRCELQPAAA